MEDCKYCPGIMAALAEVRAAIPISFIQIDRSLGEQVRALAMYAHTASNEIARLRAERSLAHPN